MNYYKEIFYPESKFGGFSDIDGVVTFYSRVNALLEPHFTFLDIGCGRGAYAEAPTFIRNLRTFRDKCQRVIGIDVDEFASKNPFIDGFHKIEGTPWQIASESIDIALSDAVLEHVENPDLFFSEIQRVIKPGGYLCMTTTNILGYVCIISRILPERYHLSVLRKAQPNRKDLEVFHAYYRCNTIRKVRRMLDKYGFDHVVYGYEPDPGYFAFSKFFYGLGVMHQKFTPGMFKLAIFAFGRKL